MNLTLRQKEILNAVIELYSKTGRPISSKELINAYNLEHSPATIRAEMHYLEEIKLLKKPHTSAGRIPTDQGYRLYVNELMGTPELKNEEKKKIKLKVNSIRDTEEDFPRRLAEVLADFSNSLAMVAKIQERHFHFCGLEEILDKMDQEMFREVAHFIEGIERDFQNFFEEEIDSPSVFIGHEHPLLQSSKCGLIVSPFKRGKEKGILALLGPDRMNYKKNLALLGYINELLN